MINKRRAIPLIVVIFLVCIVLALGLYHVFTSFDIKRSEDIVGAINVTTTGSSENIPLATSNNGDFSGIFSMFVPCSMAFMKKSSLRGIS